MVKRLDANDTVPELQQYVQEVRKSRSQGRPLSPLTDMVMHLVEEVGEVARAIRRDDRENLDEELADCLFYILAAANEAQVDLISALMAKEERNRVRFGT